MTLKINGVAAHGATGRKVIHQCPPDCGKEHGGKPKRNNWHCKVCGDFCICSDCHGLMFGKSKETCKVCKADWDSGGRIDYAFGSFWTSWGGGDVNGRSLPYSDPDKAPQCPYDRDDGTIRVTKPKRVAVPTFEIASCPTISIDEIKERRFRRG